MTVIFSGGGKLKDRLSAFPLSDTSNNFATGHGGGPLTSHYCDHIGTIKTLSILKYENFYYFLMPYFLLSGPGNDELPESCRLC